MRRLVAPISDMLKPRQAVLPVAPLAYEVILEPGIEQFHEFESPRTRVHTRIN